MNSKLDCEYAKQEKWSSVIYRCSNPNPCNFEMIYAVTKYCIWNEEKEKGLLEKIGGKK